ncbi:MAG TPA: ECF-type sigma factor [Thermoanaerobaculia bacterium]
METESGEITRILAAARRGEPNALDRLLPLVYDDLRFRARLRLRRHRPGQTLDTTALVHEAYLKLVDQSQADYRDRCHFFAAASMAMRHILVDSARRHAALKRGGAGRQVTLDSARLQVEAKAVEILALDEALRALAEVDERLARLVELRFFGGLTLEETAEALQLSERTVQRDWRTARAFLYRTLQEAPAG